MSILATIVVCWAAVHIFVAGCYAFLFFRQRHGAEYMGFAVLSAGLAIYSFASAMVLEAPDSLLASRAQGAQILGITVALTGFVAFSTLLVRYPHRGWLHAVLTYGVLQAIGVLTGAYFDPAEPRPMKGSLMSFAPTTHEVVLQPIGLAAMVIGVIFGTLFLFDVRHKARGNSDLGTLSIAGFIALPAWTFDVYARVTDQTTVYIFDHAAIIATIVISYRLMRRFVQAGDELERRTLELRRSYDELRHVQQELVRKEQLAAVGELSAVIAHEVRNPLAVLKNAVSGLRRTSLGEEDRATLFSILDEETDRLNRLVRDLLAYARPVEPQATPVLLETILRNAIDIALRGSSRAIDIRLDLDGLPESVEGDKDLLERALGNIVENAVQAMPNGGRLSITGSAADRDGDLRLTLAFRDTGEGMDTLIRSRARDPFFTTRASATGLGLAIVERVIRAHGGTIELAKNEEAGSTVKVTLPARRSTDSR